METIIIIVNNSTVRKKVKAYLKAKGLGGFVTFHSTGTYGLVNREHQINRSIDVVFDNKSELINKSKIIAVVNDSGIGSEELIDSIFEIFSDQKKSFDTGIAFSIPINIKMLKEYN